MRFLPVALLGLASIAIADLSSWSDVVGDVPQCIKTCLNEFYSDSGLESACGSADTASVKCLCGVKDSASDIQDEGNQLSSCIQTGCTSVELNDSRTELQDFETRYSELMSQCTNEGKLATSNLCLPFIQSLFRVGVSFFIYTDSTTSSSTNGASSVVPGFQTMIASGVVLLIGTLL